MRTWPLAKKTFLTNNLNKKNFHLIRYLLTTFIFFPFFSIGTYKYTYLRSLKTTLKIGTSSITVWYRIEFNSLWLTKNMQSQSFDLGSGNSVFQNQNQCWPIFNKVVYCLPAEACFTRRYVNHERVFEIPNPNMTATSSPWVNAQFLLPIGLTYICFHA